MLSVFNISIALSCLGLTSYFYFGRSRIPKGLRSPPGPPRKFIIGNLKDIPSGDKPDYITYVELAKKYGELVYLEVMGKSILLVSSDEMAHELFVKRGTIYSERIVSPLLHDLSSLGLGHTSLITMPYSEKVTKQRAIIHDLVSTRRISEYSNMLEEAIRKFLCDLNSDPDHLQEHIRHALGASIMELLYGIKIRPKNDPFVQLAERTLKCMTKILLPGSYKVDFFPILKYLPSWFPGLEFPAAVAELDSLYRDMMERPFAAVEESFKSGQARPSFVSNYLEKLQVEPSEAEDKETIQQVATIIYIAGIDTTDVALQTFFLSMAIHPEVQRKAHEELDRVMGRDGLPSFSNQRDLPYVNAICKEIQRWHAVAPVALPHRLLQDDVIGEYFIPKGTIIIGNTRALLRSSSKYGPDADKFRPERFLDDEKLGYPDAAFGYGRRICPGRHFAEAEIFIMVACTLHMFNILPHDEKAIRDIFGKDLFDAGGLSRPAGQYRCKFQIRPGMEKVMRQILIKDEF